MKRDMPHFYFPIFSLFHESKSSWMNWNFFAKWGPITIYVCIGLQKYQWHFCKSNDSLVTRDRLFQMTYYFTLPPPHYNLQYCITLAQLFHHLIVLTNYMLPVNSSVYSFTHAVFIVAHLILIVFPIPLYFYCHFVTLLCRNVCSLFSLAFFMHPNRFLYILCTHSPLVVNNICWHIYSPWSFCLICLYVYFQL